MDEKKVVEALSTCVVTSNRCFNTLADVSGILEIQGRINKKQAKTNKNLAAYAVVSTIFAVVAAAEIVEQRTKIKQLELRVRKIAQGKESNECNA